LIEVHLADARERATAEAYGDLRFQSDFHVDVDPLMDLTGSADYEAKLRERFERCHRDG